MRWCLGALALALLRPAATRAQDVHIVNEVPGDFPVLTEAVLADALQDDDADADERWAWLGGEDPDDPAYLSRGSPPVPGRAGRAQGASRPASCHRPCGEDDDEPMICYFRWRLEPYVTMGRACGSCPRNVSDCTAPQCVTADGFEKGILTVNRKLPGPSIHVCLGDLIVVDVKNLMPGRSTAIHWHGVRQRGSQHMDGVPMVTQCPIPENGIFRYRFRADEVGTHFWHSHDGMQKMDGVVGALVVRGPARAEPHAHLYDHDLRAHTLVLTDWFHTDADQRFPGLLRRESGQIPDSYLVNGRGSYRQRARTDARLLFSMTLDSEAPYAVFRVSRGQRYRFRFIGATCASCAFTITVQDHALRLIAVDISPVRPVLVDSLTISPGERYDVILEAKQPPAVYWIHVRGLGACALAGAHQVALLRYTEARTAMPSMPHPGRLGLPRGVVLGPENSICTADDPAEVCVHHLVSLRSIPAGVLDAAAGARVPIEFGFRFHDDEELFRSGTFQRFFIPPVFPPASARINNVSNILGPSPLLTQLEDVPAHLFCTPGLLQQCAPAGTCECLHIIKVGLGEVVEFVIGDAGRIRNALSHPFHAHGHYFHILALGLFQPGQSMADVVRLLDRGEVPFSVRPVEKDTIAVPSGGYAVVRMVADNPGFWMFHCHFLYHLVTGMSVVLQVGDVADMPPAPRGFPKCGDFF
ncbi:Oxidoreductase OpS5 [Frankliniella fusca]|uniref:Oxidoreductase OpS5 n=1 Tax=Frankliniella fusca TaxID=407009 RepID=A0AAE1L787_9NEOP|nr:Oxidoreductase OpS5 [Frankliniella fusca]